MLPEEFIAQGRVTAHYKRQLQDRTVTPGSVVTLDECAVEILKKRTYFEQQRAALDDRLRVAVAPLYKSKASITKALGDWYDAVTEFYTGHAEGETLTDHVAQLPFFKRISPQNQQPLVHAAEKMFTELIAFNTAHAAYGKHVITFRDRNEKNATTQRAYEFNAHLRSDIMRSSRPMTFDEWNGLPFLFMDIEIPRFTDDDREISHVGMHYVTQGRHIKILHTLRDPGVKKIRGYRIRVHENEAALIDAVVDSIQTIDPYWIIAYNAKFDLIQLRENLAGEAFGISNRERAPTKDVAIPMFERVGITGRQVVCEWLLARTGYKDLPNRKFELTSQTALGGDGLHKSITYTEQESLQACGCDLAHLWA